MSDNKDKEAQKLIDQFATTLLDLNGGNKIPTPWKNYLIKQLRPEPRSAGRKNNPQKIRELVREITLNDKQLSKPHTKHHNPTEYKDRIAKEYVVSRKTVERRMKDIDEFFSNESSNDSSNERATVCAGIGDGLFIQANQELEDEYNQQQKMRKRRVK